MHLRSTRSQDLLQDPGLPRYLRILTLIILGTSFDDWDDTETCRLEAEHLWEQARRQYAALDIPDAFQAFSKLRVQLDAFDKMQREGLEMIRNLDGKYEVDDEEEEDEEKGVKEEEREADVEIDVDADADVGVDAAAAAVSDDVSAVESEKSLDGMEDNTPDVAPYEHAMGKGEPSVSNEAEDTTDTKSDEGTEDKKALAMVRIIKIKDTILGHQLIFIDSTPKQIDWELALQSRQKRWFGPSSQPRHSS